MHEKVCTTTNIVKSFQITAHSITCRLVRVLLDEVLSSTIERCIDPVLMEQSVSITRCYK